MNQAGKLLRSPWQWPRDGDLTKAQVWEVPMGGNMVAEVSGIDKPKLLGE